MKRPIERERPDRTAIGRRARKRARFALCALSLAACERFGYEILEPEDAGAGDGPGGSSSAAGGESGAGSSPSGGTSGSSSTAGTASSSAGASPSGGSAGSTELGGAGGSDPTEPMGGSDPSGGEGGDGTSNGGTSSGGTVAGGSAGTGSAAGGSATGGSAAGGSATGGSATGGGGTGGSAAGGSAAGGTGGAPNPNCLALVADSATFDAAAAGLTMTSEDFSRDLLGLLVPLYIVMSGSNFYYHDRIVFESFATSDQAAPGTRSSLVVARSLSGIYSNIGLFSGYDGISGTLSSPRTLVGVRGDGSATFSIVVSRSDGQPAARFSIASTGSFFAGVRSTCGPIIRSIAVSPEPNLQGPHGSAYWYLSLVKFGS